MLPFLVPVYVALYERDRDGTHHEISAPTYERRIVYPDEWTLSSTGTGLALSNRFPLTGFIADHDTALSGWAVWTHNTGGTQITHVLPFAPKENIDDR